MKMEIEKKLPEKLSDKLHQSLHDLIGLHRQLYDVVKSENDAIANADVKATYEAAAAKEALIHWIHQAEMSRQSVVFAISQQENFETKTPSLRELILHFQASDIEASNRLQSDLNVLVLLVERIKKQNEANGSLVAASLKHIDNMKRNIFGETTHQARTYNQQGQKNTASANEHGPRLISREV
jgi:flagellar biosynthesis/type III secretory pathway chaperone